MNTDASTVLNFLVARKKASEDQPLKLGNVEFWHPIPGLAAGLCYSHPTNVWDVQAVQEAVNKEAEECWPELVKIIESKNNQQTATTA